MSKPLIKQNKKESPENEKQTPQKTIRYANCFCSQRSGSFLNAQLSLWLSKCRMSLTMTQTLNCQYNVEMVIKL